ncbi:hypothetical protein CRUP_033092 [Coryphaenoides rupestris]|nr:hypothetical protein CRUP_033092 [Coryphaenoides rupestris]
MVAAAPESTAPLPAHSRDGAGAVDLMAIPPPGNEEEDDEEEADDGGGEATTTHGSGTTVRMRMNAKRGKNKRALPVRRLPLGRSQRPRKMCLLP